MLAARDWTTQEIAKHLNVSVNTVKIHISEAMRKLNVENRKGLKQYSMLNELINRIGKEKIITIYYKFVGALQ